MLPALGGMPRATWCLRQMPGTKKPLRPAQKCISWVEHHGLYCYSCLMAPDLSRCQWHQWKLKYFFWHYEVQRKTTKKLKLLKPTREIEKKKKNSAFICWAFVIQPCAALTDVFIHISLELNYPQHYILVPDDLPSIWFSPTYSIRVHLWHRLKPNL